MLVHTLRSFVFFLVAFVCYQDIQAFSKPVFQVDAPFPARSTPQSQLFFAEDKWWGIFPHKDGQTLWKRTNNNWQQVNNINDKFVELKGIADIAITPRTIEAIFPNNQELIYVQLTYNKNSDQYDIAQKEKISIDAPTNTSLIESDIAGNIWIAYLSDGKIFTRIKSADKNWSDPFQVSSAQEKALFLNGISKQNNNIGILYSTDKGVFFREHIQSDAISNWRDIESVPAGENDQHCNCLHLVSGHDGSLYVGTKKIMDAGKNYEKDRTKAFAYAKRLTNGEWVSEPYANLPKKGEVTRNPSLFFVSDPAYLFFGQFMPQHLTPQYIGASPLIPEPARNGVSLSREQIPFEVARSKDAFNQNAPMILLSSDEKGQIYETNLPNLVCPNAETDFSIDVGRPKDHVDDIAFWVHPTESAKSFIIGSNKLRHSFDKKIGREETGGLNIYDLNGKNLKFFEIGSQNNVDIRYGFNLGNRIVDIVSSSNQMDNTISIYAIDQQKNDLLNIAARPIKTGIEVYGYCLGYDKASDKYYAFVNSREGHLEQYELFATADHKVDAKLVRSLKFDSQVEGCAVDDEYGHFYIGEEKIGIWKMSLNPSSEEKHLIHKVGGDYIPQPDLEGLSIYYTQDGKGYLLASSQGSSEYVVFTRGEHNDYVKTFKIVSNGKIDGTELTDGIDVTSANLGPLFPDGAFIAHDSISNKTGNSNFKFVSWRTIAETGPTKLTIDNKWNPRSLLPKERQDYVSNQVK
jgi:3-phytase